MNTPDPILDAPHAPIEPGPQGWVRDFRIGEGPSSVRVWPPFVLAPMSGVTDSAFRRLVKRASRGAVGLLVTEFISIEGLTRRNVRSAARMASDIDVERPLSVQIFGADVERMADAARVVEEAGADVVDVNCGCPAPKVVRRGGGADLLKEPDKLARIVEATRAAVKIPVTVKIRSGWDEQSLNAVDIARKAEAAGAAMIAVHGRTRTQLYRGQADWEIVADVKQAVRIPVLGSGDVVTAEAGLARLRDSGVDGVMIGRGAILNPWIFGQIMNLITGEAPHVTTLKDRQDAIVSYRWMLAEQMPPRGVQGRLKQLLARLTKGMPYGTVAREAVMRLTDPDEIVARLADFFEALREERIERWAAERGLQGRATIEGIGPAPDEPIDACA